MKKIIFIIMLFVLSSVVFADTQIIYTNDDSYDATIKFKNGVYEKVLEDSLDVGIKDGNAEWYKGYLQFDLSSIPEDAVINSATLTLYYNDVKNNPTCEVYINIKNVSDWYPIDETDWNLDGQTIDLFLTGDVIRNIYYDYDITSYANDNMLNIMFESSNYPDVGSGECKILIADTSAERPKLTINYDVPINYTENTNIINIEQVYYSPQVLQGGYTEIFAIIKTNGSTPHTTLTLTYPDNNSREITMYPTVNENEYRAFITDTFQVGITKFLIEATVDNYFIEYGNQYIVAKYNLDFVETVNSVALCQEVETVKNVDEPNFDFFGTEYEIGEAATVFLQLRDGQGLPENNGDCHIDIYYPSQVNETHPVFVDNAPMVHKDGSKGLYYYDFYVPNISGVYMMSASCSYSFAGGFCYSTEGVETDSTNRTIIYGAYTGDTISLNTYNDYVYTKCVSDAASKECTVIYDFNTSHNYYNLTNITDLNLFYMGEATETALTIFYAWNWTDSTWITLPNSLTYSGSATATSAAGINDFVSNSIPSPSDTISPDGIIRIQLLTDYLKVYTQFNNWLNVQILTSSGTLHDLKGGGEIHASESLTEYFEQLENGQQIMPTRVWNYTNRTLTEYREQDIANAVWQYTYRNLTYYSDVTNYLLAAEYVWNRTNRNLTYYQDFRDYSELALYVWNSTNRNLTYYQDIVDYALVSEYVWNRTDRNLTFYEDIIDYLLVSNYVWNNTNRSLTYYQNFNDFLTASEYVWNNTNRNLTYYPPTTDETNYLAIQEYVWNRTNRNLTYYEINDYLLQAGYIWNSSNRSLTYYPPATANVDYELVSEYVWNETHRNLTYYAPAFVNNTAVAQEVWSFNNRNLTYYQNFNDYAAVAEYVWNRTDRNLTFYPSTTDETDYLAIQEYVWNRTNRNLTYYQINDYLLQAEYIWNETVRDLTYYPPTTDETNYLAIQEYVWNRTNRNLTYYEINDYLLAAEYVWNSTTRDLTSYLDMTNYTLLSDVVWSNTNRNLTYYEDVTNYNLIPIYVWNYTTRELSFFDYVLQSDYNWNSSVRNLTFYENFNDYPEIAEYVWNRSTRDLTFYQNFNDYLEVAEYVWNRSNRNLTYYEDFTNYLLATEYVWNATNRNLTYYEPASVNNTAVAEEVWAYSTRTLTDYAIPSIISQVWNYTARYTHGIIV